MAYYETHLQERQEYQRKYYHDNQAKNDEYKQKKKEYNREYQRRRRAKIKLESTINNSPINLSD